ncbi:MAG: hypothetical protein JXX29_07975 [Deltaproteobacteria bacterium]|nr:hypothetical protein [Deltaproteobacteria bacterium]MBN2671596.1 hypothetical protein [Deltaproteobacteria bacterium]
MTKQWKIWLWAAALVLMASCKAGDDNAADDDSNNDDVPKNKEQEIDEHKEDADVEEVVEPEEVTVDSNTCLVEILYAYNDLGNLVEQTLDAKADGTVDAYVNYAFATTEDGWPSVVETSTIRTDGRVKFETTHELNELGDTVFFLYNGEDFNVSFHEYGEVITEEHATFSYTLEYDDNHHLSARTLDLGADNTPDEREMFTSHSDGRLSTYELDEGADDTIDVSTSYTYTYNELNQRISLLVEEVGLITTRTEYLYEYDELGNRIVQDKDVNQDGILEEHCEKTFDAQQQERERLCERYVNGALESLRTRQLDENGNVVLYLDEWMDDGYATRSAFTYDELENMLSQVLETRVNEDASWEVKRATTYTYDSAGKKISATVNIPDYGPGLETCADVLLPTAQIDVAL